MWFFELTVRYIKTLIFLPPRIPVESEQTVDDRESLTFGIMAKEKGIQLTRKNED